MISGESPLPVKSQSKENSNASRSLNNFGSSGSVESDSHCDTDDFETPQISPISSWDFAFFLRRLIKRAPSDIREEYSHIKPVGFSEA